jgi:hypothetical protein
MTSISIGYMAEFYADWGVAGMFASILGYGLWMGAIARGLRARLRFMAELRRARAAQCLQCQHAGAERDLLSPRDVARVVEQRDELRVVAPPIAKRTPAQPRGRGDAAAVLLEIDRREDAQVGQHVRTRSG